MIQYKRRPAWKTLDEKGQSMREDDFFYLRLLRQCQSADPGDRLDAWRDLCDPEYLALLSAQFLLDHLNSTSNWQEHSAILDLMCLMKEPLPIDALIAILEDRETSGVWLRMGVAHTLAFRSAKEVLDLFLRMVLDAEEDPCLRADTFTQILEEENEPQDERLVRPSERATTPSIKSATQEEDRFYD